MKKSPLKKLTLSTETLCKLAEVRCEDAAGAGTGLTRTNCNTCFFNCTGTS
jgi:hypothetical protein